MKKKILYEVVYFCSWSKYAVAAGKIGVDFYSVGEVISLQCLTLYIL